MRKKTAWLLIFVMMFVSVLSGCGPSQESPEFSETQIEGDVENKDVVEEKSSTAESEITNYDREPIINMQFTTNESTQLALAESDDAYMSALGSPFYISSVFTDLLENKSYVENRRELIDEILTDSALINELVPKIENITNENRNDLFGLFDSFIEEDLELPYIYTASNRYTELMAQESLTEAQLDGIVFDGYDTLTDGWMAYKYAQLSLKLGVQHLDRLDWIMIDGANLTHAAKAHENEALMNVSKYFEEGIQNTDKKVGEDLGNLAEAVLRVEAGFTSLKMSDEYMSLAAMKFLQGQIPEMRSGVLNLIPDDVLTSDDIEAMSAFVDVLEGYAYGAELLYLEDSSFELALEKDEWLNYVKATETKWYENMTPIAYAAASEQILAESSAYNKKASEALAKSKPKIEEKVGWLGRAWSATKSAAVGVRQTVGAVLDTTSALTKSGMDIGMGLYYGVDAKDVVETIDENITKVGDNFRKGISGSTVLGDSKKMIEAVEGVSGTIAKSVIGDNAVSSGIDNTSKFITGIATGFAKGVFDLANAKTTGGEKLNAVFDVATSFISFSKVAKFVGKPFVKLGAAATKAAGSALGKIAQVAKKGVTVLAKKGAKFMQKVPKLFNAAQKSNFAGSIKSFGTALFNGAKNIGSKVSNIIIEKTSKVASSVKSLTQKAKDSFKSLTVKKYPIGEKISNKLGEWGKSFKDIFKKEIGNNVDEFAENYAENEGWNTVKEMVLLTETAFDSVEERTNRDNSNDLMEAKRNSRLPSSKEAKEAEQTADEFMEDAMDETITDEMMEETTEELNSDESADVEDMSTKTDDHEAESEVGAEEIVDDMTEEMTEDSSDNDSDENLEDNSGDSTEEMSDQSTETKATTNASSGSGEAGVYQGVYTGIALEMVFYDTESGNMSIPLGAQHSNCRMTIRADGYVQSELEIFGTGMVDFGADFVSSFPAELKGNTMTYYFVDDEGDKSTITGSISESAYTGTIGIYSGTNQQIGHITFNATR